MSRSARHWPSVALVLVLLFLYTRATWPGRYPPVLPDSLDYTYGALSLLHGEYSVDWDGAPRTPRYTPGFPLLLVPAVALGGPAGAEWVPYLLALGLGGIAAGIGARIAGPLGAPLTLATVLFAQAPAEFAGVVMGDLPAATLGLAEVALLMLGRSRLSTICAGLLAGVLVWMRPVSVVLLLAGLAGVSARADRRRWAPTYAAAAAVPLIALAIWQWQMYGSPLTSSYVAASAGAGGGRALDTFFAMRFAVGPPFGGDNAALGGRATDWNLPNIAVYPLQLIGADAFLGLPGVGLIGLVGLVRFARQEGPRGVLGRFGLVTVLTTLAVYVPYFWQSGRFLFFAAVLLNLTAAVALVDVLLVTRRLTDKNRGSASLRPRDLPTACTPPDADPRRARSPCDAHLRTRAP